MELVSSSDQKALESLGLTLERLSSEDLEAWFDHVAAVFSKTGRGYFVDHFEAEPTLDSILVIKDPKSNTILSTMRLFDQQIVLGTATIRCAGVGEVSTKEEWRGKGLASILLRALKQQMSKSSFSISSLHTSRVGFYSKFDYKLLETDCANATISVDHTVAGGAERAVTPLEAVSPVWKELHASILASHKFQGLLVRSEECWQHRIPKEVQRLCGKQSSKKAFSPNPLAFDTPFPAGSAFQWVDLSEPSCSAVFLSAQYEAEGDQLPILKIREFLVAEDLMVDVTTVKAILASFIRASVNPSWEKFIINCPGAIWREFIDPISWISLIGPYQLGHLEFDTSDGIMYSSFDGKSLDALNSKSHLFLSLDSF